MRRVFTITVLAALALVMAAGAPALADPGGNGKGQGNPPGHAGNGNANGGSANSESPPGFNGTVKIHDGDGEAEPIKRNEPHVGCTFHVHGFNFDAGSSGTWSIQSWPPTGDRGVVASGTWGPADGDGDWRTAVMSLPGGDHNQGAHYKLNVDQTNPSAPGAEKHKVFWVDCPPVTGGGEEEEEQGGNEQGGNEQNNAGGQQESNVGGQQQQNAVAGVQQPPMFGGVSPMAETAAQPGAQAAAQVAGQQAAPVASLPSTSTAQTSPFVTSLLMGIGVWLMRRRTGGS
jgi:hypothetical protein